MVTTRWNLSVFELQPWRADAAEASALARAVGERRWRRGGTGRRQARHAEDKRGGRPASAESGMPARYLSPCFLSTFSCSHYGPVLSVTIPRERSYGFVRFWYPETVRLLLSNWNPQVPHFIFGAGLYVDPYISYKRRIPAVNHGPNDPDGGLEHMSNAPGGVAGQVPGVPDGNAAQQDMNPAGNHGLNGPGGGLGHVPNAPGAVPDEVLGVLDGDAAEQDMNPAGNHVADGPNGGPAHVPNALGVVPGVPDEVPGVPDGGAAQQDRDEIAVALPDVDCFY